IRVVDGLDDWGWGVIVNVMKQPSQSNTKSAVIAPSPTASAAATAPLSTTAYLVDTLLLCSPVVDSGGADGSTAQLVPRPCALDGNGEMHVLVPRPYTLVSEWFRPSPPPSPSLFSPSLPSTGTPLLLLLLLLPLHRSPPRHTWWTHCCCALFFPSLSPSASAAATSSPICCTASAAGSAPTSAPHATTAYLVDTLLPCSPTVADGGGEGSTAQLALEGQGDARTWRTGRAPLLLLLLLSLCRPYPLEGNGKMHVVRGWLVLCFVPQTLDISSLSPSCVRYLLSLPQTGMRSFSMNERLPFMSDWPFLCPVLLLFTPPSYFPSLPSFPPSPPDYSRSLSSSQQIALPTDLRPKEARQAVLVTLRVMHELFFLLPVQLLLTSQPDPVKDMGIMDESFLDLVHSIDKEESKLATHPLFKAEIAEQKLEVLKRRGQLLAEAQRLKMKTRESQLKGSSSPLPPPLPSPRAPPILLTGVLPCLFPPPRSSRSSSLNSGIARACSNAVGTSLCSNAVATSMQVGWCSSRAGRRASVPHTCSIPHPTSPSPASLPLQLSLFKSELRNRSRVLKRLGHIDADGVVQLKGRAACVVTTGDELLVTELMLEGAFNSMDPHQLVAVASCFLPSEKSNEEQFGGHCMGYLKRSTGDELLVTELMLEGAFHSMDPHQLVAVASCFLPSEKSNKEQMREGGYSSGRE
ncbi:unnamed protein product, partial [Closterium sp. NIES-54]